MTKFAAESGKRTMVIGHRGGNYGPENSMKCFQGAMDNDLEGIEFDVSEMQYKLDKSLFVPVGLAKQRQCRDGVAWRG